MYIGFDVVATPTGSKLVALPFYAPVNGYAKTQVALDIAPEPVLAMFFTVNGNTVAGAELMEWVGSGWTTFSGSLGTDQLECKSSVATGTQYLECIADLTAMGLIDEDHCEILDLEFSGLASSSAPALNSDLKDFSDVGQRIRTSTCGDLTVIKESDPPLAPGTGPYTFDYRVDQSDDKPVWDEQLLWTGGQPANPATDPPTGDTSYIQSSLSIPDTNPEDTYQEVICEIDYDLQELPFPPSPPAPVWTLDSIQCTYTDIFDSDFTATNQPRVTADIYPEQTPKQYYHVAHKIAPGNITVTDPTICVITNSGDVPVSIGSFQAQRSGNGIQFDWTTSTEAGNVGFYLYVKDDWDQWQQIELVPALAGDSFTTRHYSQEVPHVRGDTFAIADIDMVSGLPRMHGPFQIDKVYGVKNDGARKTNWRSIRKEHKAKKKARLLKRKDQLKQKMRKLGRTPKSRKVSHLKQGWIDRLLSGLQSLFVSTAHAAELPADSGFMQIKVRETGIYRVSYKELVAASLTGSRIKSADIALTNGGDPVPIRVKARRVFRRNAYIEFVGKGIDTLYSDTNVYVLHLDRSKAVRVPNDRTRASGEPVPWYMETVKVEPQLLYSTASPNGDPWYAERMFSSSGNLYNRDITIEVDEYIAGAAPATVSVSMWGASLVNHHVQVSLNDILLSDDRFYGRVSNSVNQETSALNEGQNKLSIHLPFDTGNNYDLVRLDSWGVTYPRKFLAKDGKLIFTAAGEVFRVGGLSSGQIVVYRERGEQIERVGAVTTAADDTGYSATFHGSPEPATYYIYTLEALAKAELAAPPVAADITSGSAEYLIISHPDFIDTTAMDDLVAMHNSSYTVGVVDADQIYAQFGHGIFGAQAIKDYISYAYSNMGTRMVHIIGGDTYDYRDYRGLDSMSFIPSLYAQTSDTMTFAPVDPKYADVDGDDVPDLAIGRTPVRTSEEFAALVAKTLLYRSQNSQTAVFASDKKDIFNKYDFRKDAKEMMGMMPEAWAENVTSTHLDDYLEADPTGGVQKASNDLVKAINDGVALTSYIGHSSLIEWTFDGLFSTGNARALTNSGLPTVVLQWGCYNTYYVSPEEDTLAHELTLNPNGGAAAVMGASGLTKATHERLLAKEVYERLFDGAPLGQVILEAKRRYAELYGNSSDVIMGWVYLGDPGLVIQP
jgi:Peptidase family C25